MSARLAPGLIVWILLAAGCARSPRQVAWDAAWDAANRVDPRDPAAAGRFEDLVHTAPRTVDAGAAEL
ncbi:MAG: hypothetical protein EP329_28215, partial [Deltaproteobacteria bacterium]